MTRDNIPLHRLDETTRQGFQIDRVKLSDKQTRDAVLLGTHRDDHYIFLLQEHGLTRFMVDFDVFHMEGPHIFFILPGQVHCYIDTDPLGSGWFLGVDPGLIPDVFRNVLEDPLLEKRPLPLHSDDFSSVARCLDLLYDMSRKDEDSSYYKQGSYGLINAFSAMVTGLYTGRPDAGGGTPSRPVIITQSFRRLLKEKYRMCKSPAEYALLLNLSPSYLNEAVKTATGSSVSHLIHYEVMLEAKRLLYHTQRSVKEIAYDLGYEDHTYFSRLFKKTVGVTPGDFRRHYHE